MSQDPPQHTHTQINRVDLARGRLYQRAIVQPSNPRGQRIYSSGFSCIQMFSFCMGSWIPVSNYHPPTPPLPTDAIFPCHYPVYCMPRPGDKQMFLAGAALSPLVRPGPPVDPNAVASQSPPVMAAVTVACQKAPVTDG